MNQDKTNVFYSPNNRNDQKDVERKMTGKEEAKGINCNALFSNNR